MILVIFHIFVLQNDIFRGSEGEYESFYNSEHYLIQTT